MKLKLWQWLVALAVLAGLILVGVALGRTWRDDNSVNQNEVNEQSLQSPQDTKVPVPPVPVEFQ